MRRIFGSPRAVVVLVIAIISSFRIAAYYFNNLSGAGSLVSISAPLMPHTWQQANGVSNPIKSKHVGADQIQQTFYIKNQTGIYYYLAYYHKQKQGDELISALNQVYDRFAWQEKKNSVYDWIDGLGCQWIFNELILSQGSELQLVWYFYSVGGVTTSSNYVAKILSVWDKLVDHKGSQVMVLSTSIVEDLEYTRTTIKDFLADSKLGHVYCETAL